MFPFIFNSRILTKRQLIKHVHVCKSVQRLTDYFIEIRNRLLQRHSSKQFNCRHWNSCQIVNHEFLRRYGFWFILPMELSNWECSPDWSYWAKNGTDANYLFGFYSFWFVEWMISAKRIWFHVTQTSFQSITKVF